MSANRKIILDQCKPAGGIGIRGGTFRLKLLVQRGESDQTMADTFVLACDLENNSVPELAIVKSG